MASNLFSLCFSDQDKEEIDARLNIAGPTAAMGLLLSYAPRRKSEWFAALVWVLMTEKYEKLVRKIDESLLSARKLARKIA